MNVLIIGGSGGIGQALVKRFLAPECGATVYATYRGLKSVIDDLNAHWIQLDATSEQEVCELAKRIPSLDILINAVGVLHSPKRKPEKSVNEFSPDFFEQSLLTNVVPTIYLAKYFGNHLKSKRPTYFVSISAKIGSIKDNRVGGWISYRCSKAALNMAIKTISIEWKFKRPNCCVLAFHPGTTDTDLSKPYQRNVPAHKLFTPDHVAHCLQNILETLEPSDSGKFISYDGSEIPW